MNNVTIYRGVDSLDGKDSLIAVRGNMMRVSSYSGDDDPWLGDSFNFDKGMSMPIDKFRFRNFNIIKIIQQ